MLIKSRHSQALPAPHSRRLQTERGKGRADPAHTNALRIASRSPQEDGRGGGVWPFICRRTRSALAFPYSRKPGAPPVIMSATQRFPQGQACAAPFALFVPFKALTWLTSIPALRASRWLTARDIG
jgi:hypothetical protein